MLADWYRTREQTTMVLLVVLAGKQFGWACINSMRVTSDHGEIAMITIGRWMGWLYDMLRWLVLARGTS